MLRKLIFSIFLVMILLSSSVNSILLTEDFDDDTQYFDQENNPNESWYDIDITDITGSSNATIVTSTGYILYRLANGEFIYFNLTQEVRPNWIEIQLRDDAYTHFQFLNGSTDVFGILRENVGNGGIWYNGTTGHKESIFNYAMNAVQDINFTFNWTTKEVHVQIDTYDCGWHPMNNNLQDGITRIGLGSWTSYAEYSIFYGINISNEGARITPSIVSPTTGTESDTTFNFTVNCSDFHGDTLTVSANITDGGNWFNNLSLTLYDGATLTGANYTGTTTIPGNGQYEYKYYAYDGITWNASDTYYFNVTRNTSFAANFPTHLEVGDYIHVMGTLWNGTNDPINGTKVTTKILDKTDWSEVSDSEKECWVNDGFYYYLFSTSTMIPGIYYILANFTMYEYNPSINWWNTSYDDRTMITINSSLVEEGTLTDFPVLLKLENCSRTSGNVQADGGDIVFIDWDDNTTKVAHEIESFSDDGTYVNATIWINHTIAAGTTEKLWMYFDNSTVANQENPPAVWDQYYEAVYHMNSNFSGGTFGLLDSTWKHNSTGVIGVPTNQTGVAAGAIDFKDGTSDAFELETMEFGYNLFNIEFWYKAPAWDAAQEYIFSSWNDGATTGVAVSGQNNGNREVWLAMNDGERALNNFLAQNTNYDDNSSWHYYSGGRNETNRSFSNFDRWAYSVTGMGGTWFNSTNSSETHSYIGGHGDLTATYYYDGVLDELRITNGTTRSSVWQNASYNMTNSPSDYVFVSGYEQQDMTLIDYETNHTLYLSDPNTPGHYASTVTFNFYNTNDGLGLPMETLKVYINNQRIYSNMYATYTGEDITIVIKDFYDTELYNNTHKITSTHMFIDLGLTFHSYKFCNMNEEWYMISILKYGASRWYEKAVCPGETIEYMMPTGYNYTLRIYDENDVDIYNNSYTNITQSLAYIISGNNISLVIDGQSVILGDILELQNSLDDATRPDVVEVVYNVPGVYSTFDKQGAILGTIQVCPALVLNAETTNTTQLSTTANTTFYPLIPDDTISENGTVTVLDDTMYLEGDTTWVEVDYGSVHKNYTYIPNKIDLFGENVSIYSGAPINVTRVTRFQQLWKFYWTKTTITNYYEATVDVDNNLNTTYNETYIYIEYANDSTPDYNTIEAYDVTNGVYLVRGENFDSSASGAHFYIASIGAFDTRSFTLTYYAVDADIEPSDAVIVLNEYGLEAYGGDDYYHSRGQWVNDGDANFIGTIVLDMNFNTGPYTIDMDSIIIYDDTNSIQLDREDFAFSGSTIHITQDAVGTVVPNGGRTYDVYFLFVDEDVVDTTPSGWLIIPIYGSFLVVHLLIAALLMIPALMGLEYAMINPRKRNAYIRRYGWIAVIFILMAVLLYFSVF